MSKLYIVATPIGHLDDITYRAVSVLKSVDKIAAEDTRHSARLLQTYGITTPCLSLHDHNETDQANVLIELILKGQTIALISDAGTPLISDPGYKLVVAAQAAGIEVIAIPGPCAFVAALSVAGLPTDRFCFEGFLPAKTQARLTVLQACARETGTLIFYESSHRIVDSLAAMQTVLGADRTVVIARELTKTFETILKGSLETVIATILKDPQQQKGEFVVLLAGAKLNTVITPEAERIFRLLLAELPLKQAAKLTADITGLKKNDLYDWHVKQL